MGALQVLSSNLGGLGSRHTSNNMNAINAQNAAALGIIMDKKNNTAYRKKGLLGAGRFAKVYEFTKLGGDMKEYAIKFYDEQDKDKNESDDLVIRNNIYIYIIYYFHYISFIISMFYITN